MKPQIVDFLNGSKKQERAREYLNELKKNANLQITLPEPPKPPTGFAFGSYGRMIAASDLHGRPGRDANIVKHGSRLDEDNYVEAELRREDFWDLTQSATRAVITLANASVEAAAR